MPNWDYSQTLDSLPKPGKNPAKAFVVAVADKIAVEAADEPLHLIDLQGRRSLGRLVVELGERVVEGFGVFAIVPWLQGASAM